jgi:hypothetical protein
MFFRKILPTQKITLPPLALFCTSDEFEANTLPFESRFIEEGLLSALESLKTKRDSEFYNGIGEIMQFSNV